MKLFLQNIIETISFQNLPAEWQELDFLTFSDKKLLFSYQQKALQNALIMLYKYYVDCQGDKQRLYNLYQVNGLKEKLDIPINEKNKKKNKILIEEYATDYTIENNQLPFYHFINRMSFWMATGSGKTLVIVKLIEILGRLIKQNKTPVHDILFLTCRDDLIDQFIVHVKEFNAYSANIQIHLYSLKEYDKVKYGMSGLFTNIINVFYYRSDLISDEQKEKILDFRNYDNQGKWYIILDEAHKGDKEDSKRQTYYSILSRNGFLFNFSATFTDNSDFFTCVYNFNLEQFITQGYGKHIYLSQSEINLKTDFNALQKQCVILKTLLLHTLLKREKIELKNYYHHPLILTLVNSVNTEDSDLELFFKEIEKVAQGNIDDTLLETAKDELIKDLNGNYSFENTMLPVNAHNIRSINLQDILEYVFNATKPGKIEVLKIPVNKHELIFKLKTSDVPFALIKIGDISEWIKNKLINYDIIEKHDNESIFKKLNTNDTDINILMGSRAFYEGWDSNRPNIILYINIGKGTDARKFVLQSIGRGIRIEPLPYKRKRLKHLYNNQEIHQEDYNLLKDKVKFIETLFIYGTKSENLRDVLQTLKTEKQEYECIGDWFEINPEIHDKLLLIPTYSQSDKILADENLTIKFEIHPADLEMVKNYFTYIGNKIASTKFDCQPKILAKINQSFENEIQYYKAEDTAALYQKPELLLMKIIRHFSIKRKEFKDFKQIEDEIVHFKHIRVDKEKAQEIIETIKEIKKYPEKSKAEDCLIHSFKKNQLKIEEYNKKLRELDKNYPKQKIQDKISINYLSQHFYVPTVLSEDDRINYMMHIIKTKSEVDFIKELEDYLEKKNNFFTQWDWWYFSKVDESIDNVYIPYYKPNTNKIEKFKPDFIFWLKKQNDYIILFIDPKGVEYTDGYRKIDGFSKIFEFEVNEKKQNKIFEFDKYNISVKLLFKTNKDITYVLENYRPYWFDTLHDLDIKV